MVRRHKGLWPAPLKVVLPEVWLLSLMEERGMPRKKHKAEEIVAKPRHVDALTAQGRPVADAV